MSSALLAIQCSSGVGMQFQLSSQNLCWHVSSPGCHILAGAPTQHLPPGKHCPYFSHLSPNCCRATLSTCSTLPPYMRQWLRHCLAVLAGGIIGSMHVPMYSLCRHTPAAPRTSNRSVPQYHHSPSSDPSAMPLFCHTCPHGSTCAQAGREAGRAHNMMWQ